MADDRDIAAVLERVLHRLEHVLPAQAPIQDFVHHNTLHGFQHLPFRAALAAAEDVNGTHGFLPAARFRGYFRAGRIALPDLDAALDDTPELRPDDPLLPGIARRQVLLAGLLGDFAGPPAASWAWWMEETRARRGGAGAPLAGLQCPPAGVGTRRVPAGARRGGRALAPAATAPRSGGATLGPRQRRR
jgi:hypothetical protein